MGPFAVTIVVFLVILIVAVLLQFFAARERRNIGPEIDEALKSVANVAQKRHVHMHGCEDTGVHKLMTATKATKRVKHA